MKQRTVIRSTRDQIVDVLRNDIFSGRLGAGERMSEAVLAERFGVSRGPVREVLSQLSSEGLVIAKPNCGMTVAPPAPESLRDIVLPIRSTLELHALKLILPVLTDQDFKDWSDLLLRMEIACRGNNLMVFPELDLALHRSFVERANQPDLLAIWTATVTRMRAHFWETANTFARRGDMMPLHRHHVELIDAFKTRNLKTAEKALKAHIADN